jgi:FkbM family methyltransferase
MKNLFRKVISKWVLPNSQIAYAQSGEDLILAHLFYKLNISKPKYLDIGANHPEYISNTYYFYMRGSTGVCIEPNPDLFEKIKKTRPNDIVLNVGIGTSTNSTIADFYLFPESASGLSTFSKEEAQYWSDTGMKNIGKIIYKDILQIPLRSINDILKEHFTKAPDLISIDVEGLDYEILQSIDFDTYKPITLCVETLGYDNNQREFKKKEIISFVESKGYDVYADTHVNTIFLLKQYT